MVARFGIAVVMALCATLAGPVEAQGILQSWPNDEVPWVKRPGSGYARSPYQTRSPSPYAPIARPLSGLFSPYQFHQPADALPPDRGTYRTLCVRMCDGYYFPISYATGSGNLTRDADKCTAACGADARLFYYPNPGGELEAMVDLTGRAYGSYPTAFKYRKTLVSGCQCRPQPWSTAELERHKAYAAVPSPPLVTANADPTVQATASDPAPPATSDRDLYEAAPLPIDRTDIEGDEQDPSVLPAFSSPQVTVRPEPMPRQVHTEQWSWPVGNSATRVRRSSYAWPGGR